MVKSQSMSEFISYSDFAKVDIKVGLIIKAEVPEWSNKLLQFTVDFGPEIGQKTIFSGVQKYYSPADFLQKKFLFVLNLPPKKMGEAESQGMMLMVDTEDKPLLIEIDQAAPLGQGVA